MNARLSNLAADQTRQRGDFVSTICMIAGGAERGRFESDGRARRGQRSPCRDAHPGGVALPGSKIWPSGVRVRDGGRGAAGPAIRPGWRLRRAWIGRRRILACCDGDGALPVGNTA